jgi:GH24 family phage-related lysozyme (muramidase)
MTAMRTSAAGRKAIADREGNKLTAYLDSVGV